MRYIVLDVETTFQIGDKNKRDPSPYNENNRLVSVGYILKDDDVVVRRAYWFFYHTEGANNKQTAFKDVQDALNEAEVFIAHNAKFDLQWMWAAGFEYDGPVYDTMIGEYILARGVVNISFSLEESAKRRLLTEKKSDLTKQYMDDNISFEFIPKEIVEEYGNGDIDTTDELYVDQLKSFSTKPGLQQVLQLMNENCVVLSRMERNGLKLSVEVLSEIEKNLTNELEEIEARLGAAVRHFMGATPVNFNSQDDLSVFLYGRRPKNKKYWADLFNIGSEWKGAVRKQKRQPNLTLKHFRRLIRDHTDVIYKTTDRSCDLCNGSGSILKRKVDGTPYKKASRCAKCSGVGRVFSYTSDRAGLQLASYLRTGEASEAGFKTGSEVLERLEREFQVAEDGGDRVSVQTCLRDLVRRGAIKTYLGTYAGGLRRALRPGDYVHPSFNQTVTATGRLSSSNPNFHNMPRGGTFEIKRCIRSRWPEGEILEADYRQLEYRVAVELGRDKLGLADVLNGVDAHRFTAEVIFADGDTEKYEAYSAGDKKKYRQASKPHTFKPLTTAA